jgi:flavin reductase (DIM6/NTAB) family NADH-FMN oxidoreductase RutF
MEFDFEVLAKEIRYKLLCAYVAPRPIALVTTISSEGIGNAAPISFFNVISDDPPVIILSIRAKADGQPKDTTRNIKENGEFVAHLVDRSMADDMLTCALAFPPGEDELKHTNLTVSPSRKVKPCRILGAPAALECRLTSTIEYPHRSIILGEVVHLWVKDECIDKDTLYVNSDAYRPLARLHGDYYIVAENLFELDQPTYDEWLERRKGRNP